ncbi:MAG: hypothetical protein ACRDRN_25520 [Sciscionella sp.]
MRSVTENACHELLLRLAGRLPDHQLWRFRDWLGADSLRTLAQALPLTLLRERVGLTPGEFGILVDCLVPAGVDPDSLTAIDEIAEPVSSPYRFTTDTPSHLVLGDQTAVVLGAMIGSREDVTSVRSCWRVPPSDEHLAKRVLLVDGTARPAQLASQLQRVLVALGELDPSVEVMPPNIELPLYHRAALDAAEALPGIPRAAVGQLAAV